METLFVKYLYHTVGVPSGENSSVRNLRCLSQRRSFMTLTGRRYAGGATIAPEIGFDKDVAYQIE